MYKKILVPLDGSEFSERTMPLAEEFALKAEAELVLAMVVPEGANPGAVGQPLTVPMPTPLAGTVLTAPSGERPDHSAAHQSDHGFEPGHDRSAAMEYLNDIAGQYGSRMVDISTVVAVGDPATEITEVAERAEVDLIAISTRGRSAMARGLLGSVADQVLRLAPVPVLILRSGVDGIPVASEEQFQNIVVPLDGSRFAEDALPHALTLARDLDTRVTLVRAVKYPTYYAMEAFQSASANRFYSMGDMEEDARSYLRKIAARLRSEGLDVDVLVKMGSPTALIVDVFDSRPGSIIVMTTHGSGGLKRWVLGSVADGVIRAADGLVMAIKPTRAESDAIPEAESEAS